MGLYWLQLVPSWIKYCYIFVSRGWSYHWLSKGNECWSLSHPWLWGWLTSMCHFLSLLCFSLERRKLQDGCIQLLCCNMKAVEEWFELFLDLLYDSVCYDFWCSVKKDSQTLGDFFHVLLFAGHFCGPFQPC